MSAEINDELTPDQWDVLRLLRLPAPRIRRLDGFVVNSLIALQLAVMIDDGPVMTPRGRKVLVRGSSRLLLDLAA